MLLIVLSAAHVAGLIVWFACRYEPMSNSEMVLFVISATIALSTAAALFWLGPEYTGLR